jgi:hypothetical protein
MCRGLGSRRGVPAGWDGWMDTGGARPWLVLTGDAELPREVDCGESLHWGSPGRPEYWCCGAVAGLVLLLARWETAESWGLVEDPFLKCIVEALDAGEAACDANDSTWSMEWACQPWLTLTMAYDKRAFRSADSCVDELAPDTLQLLRRRDKPLQYDSQRWTPR